MYEPDNIRGSIQYVDRYKQLISYAGLERMRRITPTDIDGLIDYDGNNFVYLECKFKGKELQYGQRVALENLVKSHEKAGHKSCIILFTHDNKPNEIIDAKNKMVIKVYRKRENGFYWKTILKELTVLEAIEQWENCYKLNENSNSI